jgi:hypothetical protein
MTVVDLKVKRARRNTQTLPLAQATAVPTDAARFYQKMVRDIEVDLGGRRYLTRIEDELISAFAGSATILRYLNVQVALGETAELDLSGYATIASTMLRIGSKLGLSRRAKQVIDIDTYLAAKAKDKREVVE